MKVLKNQDMFAILLCFCTILKPGQVFIVLMYVLPAARFGPGFFLKPHREGKHGDLAKSSQELLPGELHGHPQEPHSAVGTRAWSAHSPTTTPLFPHV